MDVGPARTREDVDQALALRERVFRQEQGVERAVCDRLDETALQITAVDRGRVVGSCRVLVDRGVGKLGWMAVERAHRGRGVGAAILATAERSAAEAGATVMQLYAQRQVEGFYAGAGYRPRGESFVAEGILHVAMEKRLA